MRLLALPIRWKCWATCDKIPASKDRSHHLAGRGTWLLPMGSTGDPLASRQSSQALFKLNRLSWTVSTAGPKLQSYLRKAWSPEGKITQDDVVSSLPGTSPRLAAISPESEGTLQWRVKPEYDLTRSFGYSSMAKPAVCPSNLPLLSFAQRGKKQHLECAGPLDVESVLEIVTVSQARGRPWLLGHQIHRQDWDIFLTSRDIACY